MRETVACAVSGSRAPPPKAESARDTFRLRRCLVPADGFYEWHTDPATGVKTPYYITRTDGQPLAFAGLWDTWTGGDGAPLHTCAIVTTHADGEIADLHPRMPVMLPNGLWDVWLDRGERDAARLKALLDDVPAPDLDARAVSTAVNDVGNDGPELIVPRADPPPPPSPR